LKSSSGEYFIGLDHIRAVAAMLVFTWHFIHVHGGYGAPPPTFPLSLLSEGHTGVALFMTLSGYLFARLLSGKQIKYAAFIYNRVLRLLPLLTVIILIAGYQTHASGNDLLEYIKIILAGFFRPIPLPNGAWSIIAEFHFYIVLPILLLLTTKWKYSLTVVLAAAVFFRMILFLYFGQIQTTAFWTIIGRIDQFLLGMLAFQLRHRIAGKHLLALTALSLFALFYWYFDSLGGFYANPSYPSPHPIWIYLPTVEGLAYAVMISWYDNSFTHSTGRFSKFIALIGTYSYSIYLWHYFIVFKMSEAIDRNLIDLSDLHLSIFFSALCFWVMLPIGFLSYKLIESPFLKFRKTYIAAK
jgi:peptidoglycan/LPS O-acetylase OafA/YrhL